MMRLEANRQDNLKKVLPKGTCVTAEAKKHQYIRNFLAHSEVFRYVIPMPAEFATFVVIKSQPERGKPLFQLYYRPTKQFLLSAQEQSMSIGCNYLISSSPTPSKSQNFVGKLRGNFNGGEFHLYDNGDNPERVKNKPRKHLAYMKRVEEPFWKGKDKEMKLSLTVPKPYESGFTTNGIHQYKPIEFICKEDDPTPLQVQSESNLEKMTAKKSQPSKQYLSRFVIHSSVNTEALIVTQKSQTFFELQIGCPLTVLQGFGYLLATLEGLSL